MTNTAKLTGILCVFLTSSLYAQKLTISNFGIDDTGIVSFSAFIEKNHSDRELYDLSIFSSADNFEKPLAYQLTSLKTGQIYSYSFDANQQVGTYEGPIQLRFAISASLFPIKPNVEAQAKLRRGKLPEISWQDFHKAAPYTVELYHEGELTHVIEEKTNNSTISSSLPASLEKGSNYELRIVSTGNSKYNSEFIPIQIISKIGLGVKLLPVAVIGAAIPVVLLGGGDTPVEDGFADPPGEPEN